MGYGNFTDFVHVYGLYVWLEQDQCELGDSIIFISCAHYGYLSYVFPPGKMAELFYVPDFVNDMVVIADCFILLWYGNQSGDGSNNLCDFGAFTYDYYCNTKESNIQRIETKIPYLK